MQRVATLFAIILLHTPVWTLAQKQGNLWFCYTNSVIDFSGSAPVLATPPTSQPSVFPNAFPGYFPAEGVGAQMAISDASGKLKFFVKILNLPNGILGPLYTAMPKIFDRNGYSMPNAALKVNWDIKTEHPIIIPHPGDTNLYYVFYTMDRGLQYSVVDMKLNNGNGDVVAGQKDILLSGWGTINGTQMTAVQGCDCIWLLIRSRTANQYFSYRIDQNGLQHNPTISDCGLLPLKDYTNISIVDSVVGRVGSTGGRLVASNDGTILAIGTAKGIELYDFEQCNGRIKNPRIIDSLPFLGLCFSPNNSRLYASQLYPLPYWGQQGQVYQFDISQSSTANITASKTLVLGNRVTACFNPILGCYCDTLSSHIADLKLAPDGKIYMSNNRNYCGDNNVPVWPLTPTDRYHYLHVIHNPDALGTACNPEIDYLKLRTPVSYTNTLNSSTISMYLPHTVVTPPLLPDTLKRIAIFDTICFRTSTDIFVRSNVQCPIWDNGSTEHKRTVDRNGKYWVSYFDRCRFTTDTFYIRFLPIPEIPSLSFACPDEGIIEIRQPEGEYSSYSYSLNRGTQFIDSGTSATGYRFDGLTAVTYKLNITAADCDTQITLTVEAYPMPSIVTEPADTLIKYGDSIQLRAKGAMFYTWWPTRDLSLPTTAEPWAKPLRNTRYQVMGINEYGCRDTGLVRVRIDYTTTELIPNAFSPNGDGLNDVFRVERLRFQHLTLFKVYNRYGQEVYASENKDAQWDGKYKGIACDAGTYYYYIVMRYRDGKEQSFKGDVALIR